MMRGDGQVQQPGLARRAIALPTAMRRLMGLGLATLSLAACATVPPPPPPPPGLSTQDSGPSALLRDWRGIIQPHDLDRYQRLDEAWTHALSQARQQKGSGNLNGVGDLIIPTATLSFATPPVGDYRCRTIKLGSQAGEDGLGYVVYGWFACRIDQTPGGLKLTKTTGSQRPSGLLFPENDRRMIFLGSMSLANDPPANSYGQKPDRDMVGVFERVGETRWRLAIPWPQSESNLDLIELVPAPAGR